MGCITDDPDLLKQHFERLTLQSRIRLLVEWKKLLLDINLRYKNYFFYDSRFFEGHVREIFEGPGNQEILNLKAYIRNVASPENLYHFLSIFIENRVDLKRYIPEISARLRSREFLDSREFSISEDLEN